MKLKPFGTPLLLIFARICSGQTIQAEPEIFPMQKGTRWIYRGEVAWEGKGGAVLRKRRDGAVEVTDSIERGRYRAVLILGHPDDLMWYEEQGSSRHWHLLISVNDSEFYLQDYNPRVSPARLNLSETDLSGMRKEESLILRLPLREGLTFGGDTNRKDGMYCWRVESVRPTTARNGRRTEYSLV